MIESVEIQNFKNIRHQRIDLEPLTVFVGANGSGKTSVLEAVLLGVHSATRSPKVLLKKPGNIDWMYTRGGQGKLSIAFRTQAGDFVVTLKPQPHVITEAPAESQGNRVWEFCVDSVDATQGRLVRLPPMEFLRLNPMQLAEPSYADRDPPSVEYDGKGLASVLAYMALNDPDAFAEVVSHMRTLIPRLKRIRFRKARVVRPETDQVRVGDELIERRTMRTYWGDAILFDFANAENVFAETVSQGTLTLLGLLTVLLGPSRPKILLMDDIEHGLHPLAQKSLLDVLRHVMAKFPDLQILATAHSPYLLDHLRPEEIRLMTVGEDGFAVCGRLKDHPQFDKWKDEMAPGELWSLFGEKWLVHGATAQ
jgi:predicted ATPase